MAASPDQEQDRQHGLPDCPMMMGGACLSLCAVFFSSAVLPALQIAGAEPWSIGPASHPHLLAPPQPPPKPL